MDVSLNGLCECGCGGPAPIAPTTDRKRGYEKGKPRRFIHGHHRHYPWRTQVPATEADRAWAAGVFDGEGSVYISPRRRTYSLIVSVGQSSSSRARPAPMVLKLREHFGGSLSCMQRPNGLPHHTWQVSCRAAELFLRAIAPYVVQRREQVALALDYREKVVRSGSRADAERHRQLLRAAKR